MANRWKALRLDLLGVRKHFHCSSRWRSCDCTTHDREDLCDRSRSSWNMKHFRHSDRARLLDCTMHQWIYWHAACSRRSNLSSHCSRIWSWPVTMHDDQGPVEKEGRDGGSLKLLAWPFGRWTIDSSLPQSSACFGGCSPNTGERKLKNRKFFCGVVGLDGRCSAQAEQRKKPVAVGPLPGAYLSTETNLVPIRGVMRKEFVTGHTHTHTRTHTHTELKRCGPPGPRR